MNFKKYAYSLAEILIALALLGFLTGLVTSKVKNQTPDIEKTRIKKAYIVIGQTIQSMINNDVLYPDELMLKNLESVVTSVGDQFGVGNPNAKFRESFMYYLNIAEEGITCDVIIGEDNVSTESNNCFRASDGVVYGIPDTDFEATNVIQHQGDRIGAVEYEYAPITVYPNFNLKQDPSTDTMIIGVRYDGKIQILNNIDACEDGARSIYCNVINFIQSDSIKKNEI